MNSFALPDSFIEQYANRQVDWGLTDAGGNSLGEITFIRTYSRVKENGDKEKWYEVCRRVIEGMYSMQKDYVKGNRLQWNDRKAQASAQEAYDRMFSLKWTPPGRGLWMMGTEFVMKDKNAAALQNCAFVSTGEIDRNDPGYVFSWVMDALMLGVGVGWDTKGKEKNITIHVPRIEETEYIIDDSREGWADSIRILINSFLKPNQNTVVFDYSKIRPAGSPIKGFGGTASGPEPLQKIHKKISELLTARSGSSLDSESIADIMNLIGTCVVAGNVRRSAELGISESDDEVFINLKNSELYPERNSFDVENPGWSWMSNNSLFVDVGCDYSNFTERIVNNGEPGFVWMDTTKKYRRLIDVPTYDDMKAAGYNPCGEQPLESFEMCTLVEVHLNRAESKEDFLRTLKFAYLYGKTVTLYNTNWQRTNAVMIRNRRIGTSLTGISGFVEKNGLPAFREWADEGYNSVRILDKTYSEWFGVRESIRTTTVKPSGTVSLLSGATPGVHWSPGGEYYLRAVRFNNSDAIIPKLIVAGYQIEDDLVSSNTTVVYFPIHAPVKRSEKEVSIFEKINMAVEAQKYWSDNSVSVTVSFDPATEQDHIPTVLNMYEGQLKSVSFLPMGNKVYPQQPYTQISKGEYESYIGRLDKISLEELYKNGIEAIGEKYCTTDVCEIKAIKVENSDSNSGIMN